MARRAETAPPAAKQKKPERIVGTRERLLLTAERLIAEEGVGQVSMRRINAEAGARNLSAVHYHFGSLEGVIAAIFDFRMGPVEQRRTGMLEELAARSGSQASLSEILHVVIWPLVETMLGETNDSNYVRFLAVVNRTPQFDTWNVVAHRNRRGLVRSYLMLRRLLSSVPPDILHVRIMMGLREAIHVLADVDQVVRERHPALRDQLVVFHASELETRLMSSLSAPVSEATWQALHALRARAASEKALVFGVDSIWAGGARPSLAA